MKEMMEKLRNASIQAILATEDVDSLEALRVKYLGKKGELTGILRQMGLPREVSLTDSAPDGQAVCGRAPCYGPACKPAPYGYRGRP